MVRNRTIGVVLLLALAFAFGAAPTLEAQERRVTINGETLSAVQIATLEQQYRIRVVNGNYWYDARAGLWGFWGGPVVGPAVPGLRVGGPLPRQASGGGTGVFVNGRELHPDDVKELLTIMMVRPGRYWMDASGWSGYEGGPPMWNVWALAAQAQAAGRGGGSWLSRGIGGGMGGDGTCIYGLWGSVSASSGCD